MNNLEKNSLPPEVLQHLEGLRQAVRKALIRKWKLGQYAVIWEDDKVVKKSGDELKKYIFEQ
ncbi:MAG: hypothetical protein OXG21_05995 [Rhodobacteraceae bacterium]|nr:hypothetical protein [Paracoccaceae bacterium]